MLIEMKLRRKNGSKYNLRQANGQIKTYHFVPTDEKGNRVNHSLDNPDGYLHYPHLCEVEEMEAINWLIHKHGACVPYGKLALEEFERLSKQPKPAPLDPIDEGVISEDEAPEPEKKKADLTDTELAEFAQGLVGIEDPMDKQQLIDYLYTNFNVKVAKNRNVKWLLAEIWKQQQADGGVQ